MYRSLCLSGLEPVALEIDDPSELIRAPQELARECLQIGGREQLDQLRQLERRRLREDGVEDDEGGGVLRIVDREVDRSGSGEIVGHGDDLLQAQGIDDRLQVAELLAEGVGRACGLVGLAEAQEVERDDAPSPRRQMGDQIVVDMQIIRAKFLRRSRLV